MEIIVNMEKKDELGISLLDAIAQQIGVQSTETFGLESFCELMKTKVTCHIIAVLLIDSSKELEQMVAHQFYLGDAKNIIILKKDFHLLMPKALALQPRFITPVNYGFDDVCAVLRKIILTD